MLFSIFSVLFAGFAIIGVIATILLIIYVIKNGFNYNKEFRNELSKIKADTSAIKNEISQLRYDLTHTS